MLRIKCFAYLPCDNANKTTYENIWSKIGKRQTGDCFNNYKVVAFNDVDDYTSYLKQHLNIEQKFTLKTMLQTSLDNFISVKSKPKKYLDCKAEALNYKPELITQFAKTHLKLNESNDSSSNLSLKKQTIQSNENGNVYSDKSRISLSQNMLYKFISIFTK